MKTQLFRNWKASTINQPGVIMMQDIYGSITTLMSHNQDKVEFQDAFSVKFVFLVFCGRFATRVGVWHVP